MKLCVVMLWGGLALGSAWTTQGCGGAAAPRPTTPRHEPVVVAPPPAPAPAPHARVAMEPTRLRVDEAILFETGSDIIDRTSDDLLREIADVVRAHPETGVIRVEGHTDRQGAARYNRDLSRRRADAIVERLVANGVEASRLEAVGYGFDRPIASNDTDEGRQRNRRVEFTLGEAADETLAAR